MLYLRPDETQYETILAEHFAGLRQIGLSCAGLSPSRIAVADILKVLV